MMASKRAHRPDSRQRPVGECVCCNTRGPIHGRGLIRACYLRNWKAGTLDHYPLMPEETARRRREGAAASRRRYSQVRAGRVDDYRFLLAQGVTNVETLASRLGVTTRTVERYAAEEHRAAQAVDA